MDVDKYVKSYLVKLEASKLKNGFSNPDKKPIGELFLIVEEDGIDIKVPALNKRWAPKDMFNTYVPLVMSGGKLKTGADLDEWIYEAEFFLNDMEFFLRLKHYQFWSYMVYQKRAIASVISFLKKSNPFYIDMSSLPEEKKAVGLYEEICSDVTRIVCRLVTNKESDEEWISKDHLKTLIYNNFLISIPMLFDLIVALGDGNLKILKRIFDSVFEIEPKYKEDLTTALRHFIDTFEFISKQAENEEVIKQAEKNENLETPYDDLVMFTVDGAMTLSILLDVYPDARQICRDINLPQKLTSFYDTTIPFLYKNIEVINRNAESLKWINELRCQLLKAFRSIVYLHIEKVMEDPANSLMPAEDFVAIMTECLADRLFVIDYQREFPIELDVDILKQACKDLDDFKTDFVAKGYKDEADSEALHTIEAIENLKLASEADLEPTNLASLHSMGIPERPQPEGKSTEAQIDYDDDKPSTSREATKLLASTASTSKDESTPCDDIDEETRRILDVLPHLGDGFVRRVLNRYDSCEEALTAILEQNLPPDLIHADQSEVYIPPDPQDAYYEKTGIKHFNVFDGDKFDVLVKENPDYIVKINKASKDDPKDLGELLDDKRDLEAYRKRYEEYSMVEHSIYDDEYDDSYDAFLLSETRIKSKDFRSKLAEFEDPDDDEEENDDAEEDNNDENDDEEEEEEKSNQQQRNYKGSANNTRNNYEKPMDFCENPEVIRARYEAKRAAKYGHQSSSNKAPPPQQRDVVGEAKGKGQSKEVTINRHKKDVNKSSRANHNRKSGAAFKRSKGMMG